MSRLQPEALAAYQAKRSLQRRGAVTAAIGKLDKAGQPVNVSAVAGVAGVDRSYIYSQPDLLAEIRQRRTAAPPKLTTRSTAERATVASLQARLASAHDEIARLKTENQAIRERLAIALGEAWETELTTGRKQGA